MRKAVLLTLLFLICLTVGLSAQPAAKKCTADKTTIYLSDPDAQNNKKFVAAIRAAVKSLRANKEDKIFIYPYPRGAWGTKGVREFLIAIKAVSERDIKDSKSFEIRHVGYRTDASVDIFVRRPGCEGNVITEDYKGDADATVERIDFPDAPLGESVFPTSAEMEELISKKAKGPCPTDRELEREYYYRQRFIYYTCGHASVYIIVGIDGRVKYVEAFGNTTEVWEGLARQTLANWAFKVPIIDGTPRHIRGVVTVEFGASDSSNK